jgi:hypothetical protein
MTVCAPEPFQVTVTVLLVEVPPAVIVPPGEMIQAQPSMPACVV